jgi:hypothetical protein
MTHFSHHFTQTLTTLYLSINQIGQKGVQHLADALEQNKVTLIPPHSSYQSFLTRHFTQTLTALYLSNNQIGDQGAQHLADVLKQNKVTLIPPHSVNITHFSHII